MRNSLIIKIKIHVTRIKSSLERLHALSLEATAAKPLSQKSLVERRRRKTTAEPGMRQAKKPFQGDKKISPKTEAKSLGNNIHHTIYSIY